ncbi:MAG: peptide chain release factor N(5)-glutamine methyltransferase [Devosiaceae bacterium]|nr:peptide chain release factor N(5)-glutamine methyltransferase [Devosiaceae bacterium]
MSLTENQIGRIWRDLKNRFEHISSTPGLDGRLLVGKVLGFDSVQLACNEHRFVTHEQFKEIERLALRRFSGEPVARILGAKEFFSLNFKLNEATLVPRPETEMLVERVIDLGRGMNAPCVLELGVGTGCILISVLKNMDRANGVGVDISAKAIEGARYNAEKHGVEARIIWHAGSWFEPIVEKPKFDFIVSNPPYIATKIIVNLERGVRIFDPDIALDGGEDGLLAYNEIVAGAYARLRDSGHLILEIGFDQGEAVMDLCRQAGFDAVKLYEDMGGQPRMIEAKKKAPD